MRSHAQLADAAVYVLRAMEPAEELEYRDHLAGCAECREEVAALQQVVDALALSAPQYAAPAALRDSVLRSIDADQPERRSRRRAAWIGALSVRPAYAARSRRRSLSSRPWPPWRSWAGAQVRRARFRRGCRAPPVAPCFSSATVAAP